LHIPCPPENASHKCKDANDPGHRIIAINLVFDNDKALVHYRHKSLKNLPHRNDTVFCGILAFPAPETRQFLSREPSGSALFLLSF
jgi:hypothetical protein